MTTNDTPALPYAEPDGTHTIGHSGTDTSRERAIRESGGQASARQRRLISALRARGAVGITVKELRELTGWHHGTASGLLSNMDKAGHIVMLGERRDGCHVYVRPTFRAERPLAARRPQSGVVGAAKSLQGLQDARGAALASLERATDPELSADYQRGMMDGANRVLLVLNEALGLSND